MTLINLKESSPVRHGTSLRSRSRVRDYQDSLDNRLSKPKRETMRFIGANSRPQDIEINMAKNLQRSAKDLKRHTQEIFEGTKSNNMTTLAAYTHNQKQP